MNTDDPIRQLGELLASVGARVTMDPRRNVTHPCWRCETTSEPRALVEIGRYTRPVGGGNLPGDAIERPLCAACEEATRP